MQRLLRDAARKSADVRVAMWWCDSVLTFRAQPCSWQGAKRAAVQGPLTQALVSHEPSNHSTRLSGTLAWIISHMLSQPRHTCYRAGSVCNISSRYSLPKDVIRAQSRQRLLRRAVCTSLLVQVGPVLLLRMSRSGVMRWRVSQEVAFDAFT